MKKKDNSYSTRQLDCDQRVVYNEHPGGTALRPKFIVENYELQYKATS